MQTPQLLDLNSIVVGFNALGCKILKKTPEFIYFQHIETPTHIFTIEIKDSYNVKHLTTLIESEGYDMNAFMAMIESM